MKLQLSYEIMFGYDVQKLQIAHLIPLKIINIVSSNKFSKPGLAGFRPNCPDGPWPTQNFVIVDHNVFGIPNNSNRFI